MGEFMILQVLLSLVIVGVHLAITIFVGKRVRNHEVPTKGFNFKPTIDSLLLSCYIVFPFISFNIAKLVSSLLLQLASIVGIDYFEVYAYTNLVLLGVLFATTIILLLIMLVKTFQGVSFLPILVTVLTPIAVFDNATINMTATLGVGMIAVYAVVLNGKQSKFQGS